MLHISDTNTLPTSFEKFFWSYDFHSIDVEKNKKDIIVQLINYGDLSEWKWLIKAYGMHSIREVLASLPPTEIKPRTRRLAMILLSASFKDNALRSAN